MDMAEEEVSVFMYLLSRELEAFHKRGTNATIQPYIVTRILSDKLLGASAFAVLYFKFSIITVSY